MNMVPVQSTSIAFVGYEPETFTLRIVFREGGTYDYHDVPEITVQQFLSSPSKGKYYIHWIKGRFNPVRIQ